MSDVLYLLTTVTAFALLALLVGLLDRPDESPHRGGPGDGGPGAGRTDGRAER